MTDEEKIFIKKINIDKAIKKVTIPIVLIILSILTYIIPLVFGDFDFGIIFEAISLACLIVARFYMSKYDEIQAKRYVICSMVSIGWIMIYDTIIVFSSISNIRDLIGLGYVYFCGEILSILYLISLFAINKDLSKADNPIKYKETTDWFYEKYEDEENKNE